jgi:hypothetical protein
MVLGVCTFLASGAEIKVTAVRNGYIAASYRWLQGYKRRKRLHNCEGQRSEAIAEESHVV